MMYKQAVVAQYSPQILFYLQIGALMGLLHYQQFASVLIQQMQAESTSSEVLIDEFELIEKDIIKGITSATVSESRKILLITTASGFVLCDLIKMQYARFQKEHSPFFVHKDFPHGSQLGSIIQARTQVALVPNFKTERFNPITIYIYDYNTRIILSKFNFNLPIISFSLTSSHLIVANNKRIVLYNYLRSRPAETEKYYLDTYRSNERADFIRYIDLFCHLCDQNDYGKCECGKYSYSKSTKYMKLVYMRIGFSQSVKSRILYLYDQKLDKYKFFYEQKPYNDNFHFSLNQNGKYLAIADDYGRKINVYNLQQNCLYSILYLGRQSKNIVNLNVITLPNGVEWLLAARAKEDSLATMHFYKLMKTATTDVIPSRYRRKFRLYRKTMRDYNVFQDPENFINPEYFLQGFKLFSISLLGEYCELIDFDKVGLHDESTINDYKTIEEYKINE